MTTRNPNYIEFLNFDDELLRLRVSSIESMSIVSLPMGHYAIRYITASKTIHQSAGYPSYQAARDDLNIASDWAFSNDEYCKVVAKKGAFYDR